MLIDKNAILQIFGCLLKTPALLDQSEKYVFDISNFTTPFERAIFSTIYNLHKNGAKQISVVDISNYVQDFPSVKELFDKENGIEYLNDAYELSQLDNFDYYYHRFKKFNLLRDLNKMGFNTTKLYCEDMLNPKGNEINKHFDELSINDIFVRIRNDIGLLQNTYTQGQPVAIQSAATGIKELVQELKLHPEVGTALQGDIFNTVCRGARRGKLYIRSGSSGSGKTRNAVGDACYMAYPYRYNPDTYKWEVTGQCDKVLYVATEQEISEIQTLILAYLSGVNEQKILDGDYDENEAKLIELATELIEHYKDNFIITQIADPNIEKIKGKIREAYIQHNMGIVFYDYIFSSPALLNEFRDLKIREDVALMMLSTALKDLAVELQIFIMTATQLSGEYDKIRGIKNQTLLRGSKSIIDKGDVGCIMLPVTDEEYSIMSGIINQYSLQPNMITDIYKNRRGIYTNIKIWSYVDLGTCRKRDLFVTNGNYEIINFATKNYCIDFGLDINFLKHLNKAENYLRPITKDDVDENGELLPSYRGVLLDV